ncbi:MAG: class I adenylate-forming enzyme family protein [Candidatus Thorarchaeota archaeon]|jgi:acyl-CoA synthetase (AMP-forming)/AMP-acid ligase II
MSPQDVDEDVPLRAFSDLLRRNALDYGDMLAVVYGDSHLTWSDLDSAISEVANSLLRSHPDSSGMRVAIVMENRPEYLASLYGAQRAGMVPAPISTKFVGREIRHVFETGNPGLCICSIHHQQQIFDAFPEVDERPPMIVVEGSTDTKSKIQSWVDFTDKVSLQPPDIPVSGDALGVQLYTGGTTGLPKGTDFTHRALLDACTLIPDHGLKLIFEGEVPESALLPTEHDLKFLVPTPLYHLSGFMPAIIMTAMKRPVVFPQSLNFVPDEIVKIVENEKITAIFMVPTQFRIFLDYPDLDARDLSSVTLLSSGGSKMPAYMKKEILTRFPNTVLVDGYGQTENIGAAIYSFLTVDDIPRITEGYIGKPISGVEMRVVNEEGNDVAPGEVGEAIYRSPSLMSGYHGDDSKTKESFDGTWFHTGDLFRVDEEGSFYYVERKSEVIFSGGEKVFPTEVEEIICQHPKVDSAVIVGIPDRVWGEIVRAFVVPASGQDVTPDEITEWCSGKMASYKKPREIVIKQKLPLAEDGKILRSALKDLNDTDS